MRLVLLAVLAAGCAGPGAPAPDVPMDPTPPPPSAPDYERVALEVQPFFDTRGPAVDVGPFSRALAEADAASILGVVAGMDRDRDRLPALAMYVAAVRLYNLGHRAEAVEWFYAGQYRARLFQALLDPAQAGGIGSETFERGAAQNAFFELAGPTINGFGGCDKDTLLGALRAVSAQNATVVDLGAVYPSVAFRPSATWSEANDQIRGGLDGLAASFEADWDERQAVRDANGVTERYCG